MLRVEERLSFGLVALAALSSLALTLGATPWLVGPAIALPLAVAWLMLAGDAHPEAG